MLSRSPAEDSAEVSLEVSPEAGSGVSPVVPTDGGTITAEFAVALPAVVGVLALCLSAVGAVSSHTILTSLAVDSARAWARGESWSAVQAAVTRRQPQATAVGTEDGGVGTDAMGERCVALSLPLKLGSWIELGVVIEEMACAPIEP